MNKNDLRYLKTERLIEDAFFSCAAEYSLDDVFIKDICSKALISRNTFYAHYTDKYELLESIYDRIEQEMLDALTPQVIEGLATDTIYASSDWCISAIHARWKTLRTLAKCSPERFRKMIDRVFIDETLATVYENLDSIEGDIRLKMLKSYVSDGLTSIILIWFESDGALGKEQVADLLFQVSHEAVAYFYHEIDASKKTTRLVNR